MLDIFFPYYVLTFILSVVLTALLEKRLIPTLRRFAKQPIYSDGPSWHNIKSGTPTMGGLGFLISVVLSLSTICVFLFICGKSNYAVSLIITIIFCALNAFVGIIDDYKKLKGHKNEAGLTPTQKLLLQFAIASLFLLARRFILGDQSEISFSFGTFNIGFVYYPLSLILIVGIINCANLTDGIDGLASGVAFSIGVSLFYISCAISEEVSFIAASIIGATLGFLIFNLHPAKVFMGDTGSLFLGALAIGSVYSLGNPLIILAVGGVYVLEGLSVILQVIYFKSTGKRLFKMAPLHHHFEKIGWSENTICIVAIILTFILSIPAYIFYLP